MKKVGLSKISRLAMNEMSHPICDLNWIEIGVSMEKRIQLIGAITLLSWCLIGTAIAQVGKPFIHDPSTIMECEGKYYTFGTRGGGLISEDGWTWNGGAERPGGGA